MDHHSSGFVASPWAAVLGHHAMASAGADAGFAAAAAAAHVQNVAVAAQHHHSHHQIAAAAHHTHHAHPHHSHPHTAHHHHHHHPHSHHLNPAGMPMDLHVPQGFPYYRYREDALCWGDRKSMEEIGAAQSSVNARILELRKEKSRDAARSRRGKENFEFYELAKMLPLPSAITSQLDKASIIRLTISYLKLRDFSGHGDPPWTREQSTSSKLKSAAIRRNPAVDSYEQHHGTHILQSLDGFILAVAADGRFLYVSETVSIYLGQSQVEMTGSSIFDYIHPSDHAEIAEQLGLSLTSNSGVTSAGSNNSGPPGLASPHSGTSDDGIGANHGTNNPDVSAQMSVSSNSGYKGFERSFCVRMKSTLTKRGCHFKSSGYRVILLLCKLRPQYTFSHSRKSQPPLLGMVALGIALPPPSVHEIRLECDMFVMRINFDFRIAHCEPRISDLLDYSPEDLVGRSLYSLCHAEDANRLRKSHTDLIEKGQVLTGYYRLMNKSGGYTWMMTCATVVCSSKNADEQNIICINYVISNRENENLILDCCQLEPSVDSIKHEDLSSNDKNSGSPGGDAATGDSHSGHAGNDTKLTSPKTEPADTQQQRSRGRAPNSNNANVNNGNMVLIKDRNTPVIGIESDPLPTTLAVTPVTTPAPPITAKRKRKSKATQQIEAENTEVTAVINEPNTKVPALERETSRTRLPPIIDEQQQQQQQQQQSHQPAQQQQTQQAPQPTPQVQQTETSVKDLEQAMSKHLPSPNSTGANSVGGPNTTDFSADALLKQQQQQQQQQQQNDKSSTIQWIGTPHYQQPAPPNPATALLRLYANRESVIRATARQTPTGVFYGDQQTGPLPTPPGSESSYDNQYLQLHSHPQKTSADAFTNLVSTYGTYHHSTIDYHNAMTPPSSVSPRDSSNSLNTASKTTTTALTNSNGQYDYADPLRAQYATPASGGSASGDVSTTSALPLKPQPYSASAAMHHSNTTDAASGLTYSNLDQPQYFTPHSSSFHLYHKGAPTSGWYSTPS
ncbi:protein trachealess isoform X1 [Glossina fuscipes]|uniref:Protein trachealess isoform X1 n=1 Tax=Glossina fuscipes TaxID=7396 RepID=A0A9C5ZLL2_9MUSC|nr:protein trachealess isoform X1 [Glossina fuscipes]